MISNECQIVRPAIEIKSGDFPFCLCEEIEGRKRGETAVHLVRAAVGGGSKRGGTTTFTFGGTTTFTFGFSFGSGSGSGSLAGLLREIPIFLLWYAPIVFPPLGRSNQSGAPSFLGAFISGFFLAKQGSLSLNHRPIIVRLPHGLEFIFYFAPARPGPFGRLLPRRQQRRRTV
jgi:hypothetical protein